MPADRARGRSRQRALGLAALPLLLGVGPCDPVLDIEGSFFPAWMVCIVVGIALTAVAWRLLVLARLAAHVGPPLLIVPCLGLLLTLWTWLLLYRT